MVNQGFYGALEQYWTVDEQPRLNRKNSWLREHELKPSLLIVSLYVAVPVSMIIIVFLMLEAMF